MRAVLDGRYIQDHFPGIGRYTHALGLALADTRQAGDSLVVFTDAQRASARHPVTAFAAKGSGLKPVNAHPMSLVEQLRVPAAAWRVRANVLHTPHCFRPIAYRGPTVVTIHDVIPKTFPATVGSWRSRLLWEIGVRWSLRSSDHVITAAAAGKRELVELFGADPNRITVVPYAPEAAFRPAPAAAIRETRARYRLPDRFVLCVGTNKPHKNLARLIEAFARLDGFDDVYLVFAGSHNPRFPAESDTVARFGLAERVRWLGAVDEADLPALYSAATAFALPSLAEGFGLPLVEAMACGAPSITSNRSAMPEVAGDGALLFDPLDVGSMRQALATVLTYPQLAADLRQRGPQRAAQFSWRSAAESTWAIYREAANRRPRTLSPASRTHDHRSTVTADGEARSGDGQRPTADGAAP